MFLSGLSESGYLSNALLAKLIPAPIPILVYMESVSRVTKNERLGIFSFDNFDKRSSVFFHETLMLEGPRGRHRNDYFPMTFIVHNQKSHNAPPRTPPPPTPHSYTTAIRPLDWKLCDYNCRYLVEQTISSRTMDRYNRHSAKWG